MKAMVWATGATRVHVCGVDDDRITDIVIATEKGLLDLASENLHEMFAADHEA